MQRGKSERVHIKQQGQPEGVSEQIMQGREGSQKKGKLAELLLINNLYNTSSPKTTLKAE